MTFNYSKLRDKSTAPALHVVSLFSIVDKFSLLTSLVASPLNLQHCFGMTCENVQGRGHVGSSPKKHSTVSTVHCWHQNHGNSMSNRLKEARRGQGRDVRKGREGVREGRGEKRERERERERGMRASVT